MSANPTKVLILEDEPIVASAMAVRLEEDGCRVILAGDGEEGLRLCEAERPDVLVIDHGLPKISGIEVIRILRTRGPLPPTIVVSGLGQEDVAVAAFRLGADDYLAKDPAGRYCEILALSVGRALERRRRQDAAQEAEREQARLLAELKARIREVGCLYGAEELLADAAGSTAIILRGIVNLITHACRHEVLSCARLRVLDETCQTDGFRKTEWMRTFEIRQRARPIGTLEIGYREKPPLPDDQLFTPEEIELIQAVADRLGRFFDKRQTENQLMSVHDELRKLSRAVEQSASGIIITDPAGNIEYVNPQFTRMTGYALSEVLGQNPRFLKSGEKGPAEYRELWETIGAGRDWSGEFHNRRKSGELYWDHSTISPVMDSGGAITHFVAVKEDVTERKRAEGLREGVLKISAAIAGCQTEDQICRAVVEGIRRHMDIDRCGLFLGDADSHLFRGTYGTDMQRRTVVEDHCQWDIKKDLDVEELFAGAAYKDGFPLGSPSEISPGEEDVKAALIALRRMRRLYGLISVDNRPSHRPVSEAQLAHIALLAEVIGNALQVARARAELEEFNLAMIGREGRLIALKEEVNGLLAELGRPPRYPPVWEAAGGAGPSGG